MARISRSDRYSHSQQTMEAMKMARARKTTQAETGPPISDLSAWERRTWLPSGDDLPDSLAELRQRHLNAIAEFETAVAAAVTLQTELEDAARSYRRDLRDAVASGQEPPPPPS